jgi:hypothetical protein
VELFESATGEDSTHRYPSPTSRRAHEFGRGHPNLQSKEVTHDLLCRVAKISLGFVDWSGGSEVNVLGGPRLEAEPKLQGESSLEQPGIGLVREETAQESLEPDRVCSSA